MRKILIAILLLSTVAACTKLTQVPEPVNTITTTEAFDTKTNANAAILGIYSDMAGGQFLGNGYTNNNGAFTGPFNGLPTISCGASSDELLPFSGSNDATQFQSNTINSSNSAVQNLWAETYFDIYLANAAITNLPGSTKIDEGTKKQLIGEAKFLRALSYFYLVNWFGAEYSENPNGLGVPLVTTNGYVVNDTMRRATTSKVYNLILSDLKDAQQTLANDYSVSNGNRTRVNQAGASALLARVYLYMGDYADAATQASVVISNNLFKLANDLNAVFTPNNTEAILQWEVPTKNQPFASSEGNTILPPDRQSPPGYFLTSSLINSFEPGDGRWGAWVDTITYGGQLYAYPFKYRVYQGTAGNTDENYTVLRLAEQYLIRAEAEANGAGGGLISAVNDLNIIRSRAGLLPLSTALTKDQVLAAIAHERQIEFFSEWGHRWFDLKRTGQAQTVLSITKGAPLPANQLLYPIPASELIMDNHLVQNAGY